MNQINWEPNINISTKHLQGLKSYQLQLRNDLTCRNIKSLHHRTTCKRNRWNRLIQNRWNENDWKWHLDSSDLDDSDDATIGILDGHTKNCFVTEVAVFIDGRIETAVLVSVSDVHRLYTRATSIMFHSFRTLLLFLNRWISVLFFRIPSMCALFSFVCAMASDELEILQATLTPLLWWFFEDHSAICFGSPQHKFRILPEMFAWFLWNHFCGFLRNYLRRAGDSWTFSRDSFKDSSEVSLGNSFTDPPRIFWGFPPEWLKMIPANLLAFGDSPPVQRLLKE